MLSADTDNSLFLCSVANQVDQLDINAENEHEYPGPSPNAAAAVH